ncbi:hypothetical protein As57867_004729, partial [Aphanomyces stellatus]
AARDLKNKTLGTPLERIAYINALSWTPDSNCTASNYIKDSLAPYNITASDPDSANRQYEWNQCMEGGGAQTTADSNSPFNELQYISLENVWYPICQDAYGLSPRQSDALIAQAEDFYGGIDPDVENVAFPCGLFDPWRKLCPGNSTQLPQSSSVVIYIEGTSHCGDMVLRKNNGSAPFVWAHKKIDESVARFLIGMTTTK